MNHPLFGAMVNIIGAWTNLWIISAPNNPWPPLNVAVAVLCMCSMLACVHRWAMRIPSWPHS